METSEKTKDMEVNGAVQETGKKEQKINVSYTIKSLANNINKLEEAKMVTDEELKELKKLHGQIVKRWLSEGFGF